MNEIPTSDWAWINEAAERFERAWKKGPRPRIEDFLIEVPESQWPPLLQELMRVEGELRARAGEGPTADEYRRRFPEHGDVVASVFASVSPQTGATTLPATDGAGTAATRDPVSKVPPELANHPDYEIIRELGQGGMGVVFLAHNRIMGLDEVLKVIGPDITENPGVFDRFQREIRAVARFQHPNIVTAHSAFRCGESLVFAMEYVDGLDLARMVKAKGPMPVKHASYFVHQAALGLQHAHKAGMVHRDIKPGNLMLTHKRGKPVIKVLDFGLAKAEREQQVQSPVAAGANREPGEAGGLTLPGEMLGTPDFIAPEQIADSQAADIRADIYSLGCTLYYLLSGRPPFPSASMHETLRAHRSMDARPLNLVRPEVPVELAALVAKMMAKEPGRRFQTPGEVAVALAPFFKNPPAASVSPSPGVDQDLAPRAGRVAPPPATETGHGLWSSLIDFTETEDAADASDAEPAGNRRRWLWPAAVAGVLLCGLIGGLLANGLRGRTANRRPDLEDRGEHAVSQTPVTERTSPPTQPDHEPPRVDGLESIENSIGMTLKLIPAGSFLMGSADDAIEADSDEKPSHRVRISKPFCLGACEVTQGQYEAVMGNNPSHFSATGGGSDRVAGESTNQFPVENVSWLDAVQFCNRLSEKEGKKPFYEIDGANVRAPDWNGKGYRLPTEAEWEYACRANAAIPTRFSFGDNVLELDAYGWFNGNSDSRTHPVGQKRPNGFGLYDMHGNLWELCWDWHLTENYNQSPADDPTGAAGGSIRVNRGGDWNGGQRFCRSADRSGAAPMDGSPYAGFRVALNRSAPESLLANNASAPTSDAKAPAPVAPGIARQDSSPVAELPPSKAPIPTAETTKPAQLFHRITAIKSPAIVIQALPVSDPAYVLFETGGRNRALWRCDLSDPANPRKLEAGIPNWVHLALSNDGRFAVVAGTDNSLSNWDLLTGRHRRLPRSGRANITAIALSPDNQLIACVSDGLIQLCPANQDATGKKKDLNRRRGEGTDLIAFCPDGRRIVSTHADRSVRVWDVKTGREIGHPSETEKAVSSMAVFHDGRRVLTSFSGPTFVWDLETNRALRQAPGHGNSIALSADGARGLIGGGNFMQVWEVQTGEQLEREEHNGTVRHVAFSSDDRLAVSSTEDSVHVWALPPGRPADRQPPVVEVVEFLPREKLGIHDCVAVSPDGRWVLTSGYPNALRLWNRETGEFIRSLDVDGKRTWSVAFSPDGKRVLSGGDDGVVKLWDLQSAADVELTRHVDYITSVAYSPDGKRAYSAGGIRAGSKDGTDFAVRVWDLESGRQLRPLEGHKAAIWSLAISNDGQYLLSGGNDAVPILWDARTGREIHRLVGHTGNVHCVAFLPNGRRAVSSGDDGTIRLWDIESGREVLLHFKDPTGRNERLAVSLDGHRLFSADGRGHDLRYWNLDTGKVIQKLKWEESPVSGTFTPDGSHAVWGGWGGLLRMYRLTDIPERPVAPPQRSPNTKGRSGSSSTTPSHKNVGKAL
jgi:WD40 repeat protein/formylglycine-generating enzyme required for sulfatase activity/serine/threonine protein kinase